MEVIEHVDALHLMTSHSVLDVQQVKNNNFKGKLYLLVDGWTFSTEAKMPISIIVTNDQLTNFRHHQRSGLHHRHFLPLIFRPQWSFQFLRS